MAEVLLFHHAHGLTEGVRAFADTLRSAGHTVHTPDAYDGAVFASLEDGLAHARGIGFDVLVERGRAAAAGLPQELVYAGFSMGVLPAQALAQTRPGARGALLFSSFVPVSEFSEHWPAGVPAQIHSTDADPFFVGEGDVEAARAFLAATPEAEMFLYPGDAHLFADASLPDHDAAAAQLCTQRVLAFLEAAG